MSDFEDTDGLSQVLGRGFNFGAAPQSSKLDEIFDYANPNTPTKFWRKERAKEMVKALIEEVIGVDDKSEITKEEKINRVEYARWLATRNNLRAEQRLRKDAL